jgi:predicted transcriptional regulator
MGNPYAVVPMSAVYDCRLTRLDLRVYAYLSWRQGRNKCAWPSQARMAKDLSTKERSIIRAVKHLVELGHILKEQGGDGRGRTNRYQIMDVSHIPVPAQKGDAHVILKGDAGGSGNPDTDVTQNNPKVTTPPEQNQQGVAVLEGNGSLDLKALQAQVAQRSHALWEDLLREFPVRPGRTTSTFRKAVQYM